jgi:hypothetical protein
MIKMTNSKIKLTYDFFGPLLANIGTDGKLSKMYCTSLAFNGSGYPIVAIGLISRFSPPKEGPPARLVNSL